MSAPCCSFCGKAREQVDALVAGLRAMICDNCIKWVAREDAPVAYCHWCITSDDGKHSSECPERGVIG